MKFKDRPAKDSPARNRTATNRTARIDRLALVDWAALIVLLGLGVLGFGPTFGSNPRYLAAGFGGILLGLGTAWAAARFRLWLLPTVGLALLAYLLFGSALAAPGDALAGFLPSLDSLRVIILGIVLSWKDLLTVAAPVGTAGGMLVVPFLASLIAAVVAGTLAWRVRNPYWTALPVLALFIAGIAFGTSQASLPLLRGVLIMAAGAAWLAYRHEAARTALMETVPLASGDQRAAAARSGRYRRLGYGAGMVAAAAAVTLAAGPALTAGGERTVLRDVVVPPVNLYDYPSPLMKFRQYVKTDAEETLFTVDGLPQGQRIRLAAMDAYDGVVYNVDPRASGSFAPVGDARQLGAQDTGGGTPARLSIEIKDYQDVWLPAGGELNGIEVDGGRAEELARSLFYNEGARTTLSTVGLQEGDRYTANVTFPRLPDDEQLALHGFAQPDLPQVLNDPAIIADKASELAGEAKTPLETARVLEQTLQEQGFFSNGKEDQPPSLAGHGASRMLRLLEADQMIGDDEQYAAAMALMARKLGMPARVVMGFYPDWEELGTPTGPIDIKGGDVHAWVEIAFEEVGWVPFDPTPDEDNEPVPPEQQPKSTPKPQVLQPPPPPQEPAELPPDSAPEPQDAEQKEEDLWAILGPILAVIGIALIPVAVLLLPLLLIAYLKLRRRRRRASEGAPSQRVGGGWEEVLSLATDLGTRINLKATRRETAAGLGEAFPGSAAATTLLAEQADRSIFGAGEPSEAQVRQYWEHVDSSLEQMRGSAGFWKRQRARYSPRSLVHDLRAVLGGWSWPGRRGKHQ